MKTVIIYICEAVVKVFPLWQKSFDYRTRVLPNLYHEGGAA